MLIKQTVPLNLRRVIVLFVIEYIIVVSNIIPFYYKVMRSRVLILYFIIIINNIFFIINYNIKFKKVKVIKIMIERINSCIYFIIYNLFIKNYSIYENILWMKVVLRNLGKNIKRNKLLNYNNKYYHSSKYSYGRNDKFKEKEYYEYLDEINKKSEEMGKILKNTKKHPMFFEKGEKIVKINEEGKEVEYRKIKIINVTSENKEIKSGEDIIPVKYVGKNIRGEDQFVPQQVLILDIKEEDFKNGKMFKRDNRIGEDKELTNKVVEIINNEEIIEKDLQTGNVKMNKQEWNNYEDKNDFYD